MILNLGEVPKAEGVIRSSDRRLLFLKPKGVLDSLSRIRSSSFLVFVLLRFRRRGVRGTGRAAAVRAGLRAIINFVRPDGTQRRRTHRKEFWRRRKRIRRENTQQAGGSRSDRCCRRGCNPLPGD